MKFTTQRLTFVLVLVFAATSLLSFAQSTPAPLGIVPTPTPQPLTASIWTDKATYVVGETATIYYNVSQASFVYIYDVQPDGIVRLIFPNAYSQSNYVSAGTHSLPDGQYQFTIAPPVGVEQLQIIASPVSLGLTPQAYYEVFPMVGSSAQSATESIQVQIMGIVPQPTYASAWTSFQIVAAYSYTPPSTSGGYYTYPPYYPPFYGTPGATWYWQNGEWYFGVPSTGWYWYFGSDGQWHFRITIHFGTGD